MNFITDDHGQQVTEARLLPTSRGILHGNIVCGRQSYEKELAHRRSMRHRYNSEDWDLPSWDSLKVYFKDGEYK